MHRVIRQVGRSKVIDPDRSHKKCSHCKELKPRDQFYKKKRSTDGLGYVCKSCTHKDYIKSRDKGVINAKRYLEEHPEKRQEYNRLNRERKTEPRRRYSRYKQNAKIRNLELRLTIEEFTELTSKGCYYCGFNNPEVPNGLDRLDSSRGYLSSNVVPCCRVCNKMKGTLQRDAFIERVRKIEQQHREIAIGT
jgi:hypothetical protein